MKIEDMIAASRADCTGCETCANVCPKNCISMNRDDEGFAYPQINHEVCISCGRCDKTCPALNFVEKMPDALPEVFVAIHPNSKIRRHSSSGGAFTALSELVLRDGGIIFGAGFDENFHVLHIAAENLDELENLRGSKYVQSQIGDVYKRVKLELENNRQVLFSGTPCQCAGLKNFLGKDFENLLTVDVMCHGTPSPKLWESYIDYRAMGHDIAHVNFRSKRYGWVNVHFEINFYDCGHYIRSNIGDIYLREFLNDLTLRPSCHACKFKFPNGKSDVTLGDAWGIQNFAPQMFDNRGASLVIVHTGKGKTFLSKANLINRPVNFEVLPMFNPAFITSTVPDDRRQQFFDELKDSSNTPVAIMQKFFHDNPQKVSTSGRNAGQEALQKFEAILRHLANLRGKNLLLIMKVLGGDSLNKLTQKALQNFKGSGVYFMQVKGGGATIFVDGLHPIIRFNVQTNFANLRGLIKNFHITNVLIDKRINLDEGGINFLRSCGVTVGSFELKGS